MWWRLPSGSSMKICARAATVGEARLMAMKTDGGFSSLADRWFMFLSVRNTEYGSCEPSDFTSLYDPV